MMAASRLRSSLLAPRTACLASPLLHRPVQPQRRPLIAAVSRIDGDALQQAADALAEAAVQHSASASLPVSQEAVAELQLISKAVKASNDRMEQLEVKVGALLEAENNTTWATTVLTLQWAIDNVGKFSFSHSDGAKDSSRFVYVIVESFLQGRGHWIPNEFFVRSGIKSKGDYVDETERAAFREALSAQIKKLTGVAPRITQSTNLGVPQYTFHRV